MTAPLPIEKRKFFLGAACIFLLTLVVYFPAMRAGFIWDDDEMLTANALVKSPRGLLGIWFSTELADYFPLTSTSLWLEWRLWGMNATGYHVTNILLHATGCVLLWRVLLRLKIPGAWFAALLFAVHPVNVESVAWIAERKNTLSLFFYLLSLLLYLRFEDKAALFPNSKSKIQNPKFFLFSLVSFVLGLLSKTSVVMFPFVLLGVAWWRRARIKREDLRRTIPFFAVSLALGLLTIWFQYNRNIGGEAVHGGTFLQRLLGAGWAVWFYLYKAVFPLDLTFVYPRWEIDASSLRSYVPLVALIGLFFLLWWKRRDWARAPLFALSYFVLMLFPVLGFFNIYFHRYSFVADHWQYASLIGIVALAAGLLAALPKALNLAVGFTLVGVFSVLTWNQAFIYRDMETLWRDTIRKNPACWMAYDNLGATLATHGKIDEALPLYTKALELNDNNAEAHSNLGAALATKGDWDAAIAHYKKALSVKPFFNAHLNLAAALQARNQPAEALRHYLEAIKLNPRHPLARSGLGSLFQSQGKLDEAIEQYFEAIRFRPDFAEAYNNLSNLLARRGRLDEALTCGAEAVRLAPSSPQAHYNLGNALFLKGRSEEAATEYMLALQLQPDYIEARYNLASAWMALEKLDDAIKQFEEVLRMQPTNAAARAKLERAVEQRDKSLQPR